jgi:hypothetical protein
MPKDSNSNEKESYSGESPQNATTGPEASGPDQEAQRCEGMKIVMKVIPHLDQRYDTVGDYWEDPDGTIQFRVSDMGDVRMNVQVLVHEFLEYMQLRYKGIKEEDVLAFDLAVPDSSPYADDPGFNPAAPYHKEHVFSDCIERLLAREWDLSWEDYEATIDALPNWTEAHK